MSRGGRALPSAGSRPDGSMMVGGVMKSQTMSRIGAGLTSNRIYTA